MAQSGLDEPRDFVNQALIRRDTAARGLVIAAPVRFRPVFATCTTQPGDHECEMAAAAPEMPGSPG